MKRFFRILEGNRLFFIFTLLIGLAFSAISVSTPMISGELITAVTSDFRKSGAVFAVFLSASAGRILLSQADRYLGEALKLRQKSRMRRKLVTVFSFETEMGAEERAGVVSFFNNDIPSLAEDYVAGTVDIMKCVSLLLLSSISLLSIHWLLAVVIVGASLLIITIPKVTQKRSGKARGEYSRQLSQYNTGLLSFLGGLPVIKSYSYRERSVHLLEHADQAVQKGETALLRCKMSVSVATAILQVAKTSAILCIGALLIANKSIPVGGLVAVLQLAEMISSPIEVLAYLFHSRNEARPLLERYEAWSTERMESTPKKSLAFLGCPELRVEHVSYGINGIEILKDVSAQFEPGKKYLITGESGSGKSTLLRLIAQIGDSGYQGKILCGGTELRDLADSSYYSVVCTVFQEPYLFYSTLKENISLGRTVSEADYREVIEKLRLGYLLERYGDREITAEDIEAFSGGERQRIAIARAMLGKPEIYLLDEVTSALDQATSEVIEEIFLKENATVIHVSHKSVPQLRSAYDVHYVLENGTLKLAVSC